MRHAVTEMEEPRRTAFSPRGDVSASNARVTRALLLRCPFGLSLAVRRVAQGRRIRLAPDSVVPGESGFNRIEPLGACNIRLQRLGSYTRSRDM